jgi:hypothetical protein
MATVPSYIGQPGTVSSGSKSSPAIGSSKLYAGRSAPLPPVKNFNAFMKQTNDEWDDALDDVNSTDMPELDMQQEIPQFQKRVHPKASRPDTPASPAAIETQPSPEIDAKGQQPMSFRKRNSNGLKDNIPGLLTGILFERPSGAEPRFILMSRVTIMANAFYMIFRSLKFATILYSRPQ